MDDLMDEGSSDKRVGSPHQILQSSQQHRVVSVSRHVSNGQVCQDHVSQHTLHSGLQEPKGSIGI